MKSLLVRWVKNMKVKKLLSVVFYSYKKKVLSKTFIFMHLMYFVIFAISIGASVIGSISNTNTPPTPYIIVIDDTGLNYKSLYNSERYILDFDGTLDDAKDLVLNRSVQAVVILDADENLMPVFQFITYDNSNTFLTSTLRSDASSLHSFVYMQIHSIPINAFVPNTTSEVLKENADSIEKVEMITFLSMAIIIVLMIVAFPALSIISNDIIYEKSDRTMELIVSSVSSKNLYYSKIMVGFLLTLTELLGVALMAVIGISVLIHFGSAGSSGTLYVISQALSYMTSEINVGLTIFTVITYATLMLLLYLVLTVIFVSFATDIETGGYWMLIPLMGMIIFSQMSIAVPTNPNSILSSILAYLPLSSGYALPIKILFDTASVWEVIISTILLLGTLGVITYYGQFIFAKNVIKYSSKRKNKKLVKA